MPARRKAAEQAAEAAELPVEEEAAVAEEPDEAEVAETEVSQVLCERCGEPDGNESVCATCLAREPASAEEEPVEE